VFQSLSAGQAAWDIVRPQKAFLLEDISFSDGGPKAWFVVVRRAR